MEGTPEKVQFTAAPSEPAFAREIFLLRQKVLSISSKYTVADKNKNDILYVERPAHLGRNVLAILGGLIGGIAVLVGMIFLGKALPPGVARDTVIIIGVVMLPVVWIVVAIWLSKKSHVTFYRDKSKAEKVLEIRQEKKAEIFKARYTVLDPAGKVLAVFRKNYFTNVLRSRWRVHSEDGALIGGAVEDSWFKAIARRLLGPMYGILRTNFLLELQGRQVGKFDRQFTLVDRYVLDMRQDPDRTFDRRVALALGVMLDTGERR